MKENEQSLPFSSLRGRNDQIRINYWSNANTVIEEATVIFPSRLNAPADYRLSLFLRISSSYMILRRIHSSYMTLSFDFCVPYTDDMRQ